MIVLAVAVAVVVVVAAAADACVCLSTVAHLLVRRKQKEHKFTHL